ncbi:bifunctional histidinol-phosphatase/imidazoleglycerol-phosphate dehydratase HisB [Bizionia sediminis]|uniref:Histidine biosynthesis bifunctional protein HisB n=1 Tax=Bizionia sediminis TaxID=1737064 RepID=A0ABW5KQJ7_9FLAO
MKKVLFIDRDGTLINETQDQQIDSFDKLKFYPQVFQYLGRIAQELDFELVLITNQDGLGTKAFPENTFWPVHNFILNTFKSEGVTFEAVYIDKTFAKDNAPTRKPNTGLLKAYFSEAYDLKNSYVIGDRLTDMELAKNLQAKGILINGHANLGAQEITVKSDTLNSVIALNTTSWEAIYQFLKAPKRHSFVNRVTNETAVTIELDVDGTGESSIHTGIHFFNHMLEQLAKHAHLNLTIKVTGDLQVDEHHTIEDTAIALGDAFYRALGSKLGMERYGFCLPMDDCLAQVAIDFGGRNWLVWEADFKREMIGNMPTEMFMHFFKSFTDAAKCNLNIKAEGSNEHHKIEAIFKAFAKAIKMAKTRDINNMVLPTTKGVL